MSLSIQEIEHIARLARLGLSDEELSKLGRELNQVVQYVERLQEVDVEGVEAMTHAVPMQLAMRPDEPEPISGRKTLQGSADYVDGLVRVPKIIE